MYYDWKNCSRWNTYHELLILTVESIQFVTLFIVLTKPGFQKLTLLNNKKKNDCIRFNNSYEELQTFLKMLDLLYLKK